MIPSFDTFIRLDVPLMYLMPHCKAVNMLVVSINGVIVHASPSTWDLRRNTDAQFTFY